MVQVVKIKMAGGERHEHIAEVEWVEVGSGDIGRTTRDGMVKFLTERPRQAFVTDGQERALIGVVKVQPPYIRTYANGDWSDNLLALPRY